MFTDVRCTIGILLFCALAAVYFDMMNLARWFFLFAHHLCSFVSGWVVWLIAFGLRSAFVSPLGGLLVSFKLSMRRACGLQEFECLGVGVRTGGFHICLGFYWSRVEG